MASATDLRLAAASLGGILGWWSLFHLSRDLLPGVLTRWTTHLWQPEQFGVLLAEAELEPVAELRLPPDASGQAQVVIAARRPC